MVWRRSPVDRVIWRGSSVDGSLCVAVVAIVITVRSRHDSSRNESLLG